MRCGHEELICSTCHIQRPAGSLIPRRSQAETATILPHACGSNLEVVDKLAYMLKQRVPTTLEVQPGSDCDKRS